MKMCFGVWFGLLTLVVVLNTYFAWYQSRSFWVMPYEWYDLPLAITRTYTSNTGISLSPWSDSPDWRYATRNDTSLPDELLLPHVDWDKECPSRRRPPMPTFDQLRAQVDQLGAKENGRSRVKVIHALGDWGQGSPLWYVWKHILDSPTRSYSSSRACARYYLNNSISSSSSSLPPMESLGPKESTEMPGFDQCIFLSEFNVEFRLMPRPIPHDELPHVRSLLVFGQSFSDLESAPLNEPSLWHENLTIGFFLTGEENCLSKRRRLSEIHLRLRFAFLTYGNCYLVNNVDTFLWPLGVTVGDGFPNNFNPEYNPPVESRSLLLNLIASFTIRKPSRMLAYLAASQACNSRIGVECVLKPQGFDDSFMAQLDAVWEVSRSPSFATAADALLTTPTWTPCLSDHQGDCSSSRYIRSLRSSIFTLSPLGNNPESYRTWEAIMAGSIPIIDEWPARMRNHPLGFYHPAYRTEFACDWDNDVYYWLKATDAPVLWIKDDWRSELSEILDQYRIGNAPDWARLSKHQVRLKEWFQTFKQHLRLLILSQIFMHMA